MTDNNNISSAFNKLRRDGGLPEIFTMGDLRKAYKKVALIYHPDKGGNVENMKQITSFFSNIDKENTPNNAKLSVKNFQGGLKRIRCVQPTWTNNNLNRYTGPLSPISPTIPYVCNMHENNRQKYRDRVKKRGARIGPRAKPYNWPETPSPIHPVIKAIIGLYIVFILYSAVYVGGRWVIRKFYKVVKKPKSVTPKKKTVRIVKNKSKIRTKQT